MIEGKLSKHEEAKELRPVSDGRSSPVMIQDALRLPNISLKSAADNIINNAVSAQQDGYASPTNLLSG